MGEDTNAKLLRWRDVDGLYTIWTCSIRWNQRLGRKSSEEPGQPKIAQGDAR